MPGEYVLTFLLLLSIPIFVFGLLEDRNFDIRNRAFEEIEVSEKNPCVITFPNVNPYSLEVKAFDDAGNYNSIIMKIWKIF